MSGRRVLLGAAGAVALAAALLGREALVSDAPAAQPAADTAIVSRSIEYLERKLAGDPDSDMLQGQLIGRYLLRFQTGARMADVKRAEALARKALALTPDPAGALARLSAIELMQHRFADALATAQRAATAAGRQQDALAALYDAAFAAGRYEVAEATLARLAPGTPTRQLREAFWKSFEGDATGAVRELGAVCRRVQAVGRPPTIAWCLTELGKLEHARGGPKAEERLLRRALAVQPGYRAALEGQADLALARGRWTDALALYRGIAVDAHPDLYLRVAECYRKLGDAASAERYEAEFARVATAPGVEPLYGRFLVLYYLRDPSGYDRALAVALRDVERRPTVESWDILSWVRFKRGELAEALSASDRAQRRGSPTATIDYHRARILAAAGRAGQARDLMDRAMKDPTLLSPEVRTGE